MKTTKQGLTAAGGRHGERITMRTARGEEDFWLLRRLLVDTWPLMPPFFNWETRRLDGAYFHNARPGWSERWGSGEAVGLWLTGDGRLVAAVHPEGKGDAWIEINAQYRWLEDEILEWAEQHLAKAGEDGTRKLGVHCWEYDEPRRQLLEARGYTLTDRGDVLREKPYGAELPPSPRMPAGYRLHPVCPGNAEDCERYAALLNAAFGRDFHKAQELLTFTTHSPSYRQQLELAAVAPDGSFAALAGMIYDEANRFGMFEPVCAVPGPRPLGLTGKLMLEGWRRVRLLGAEHCYVGTGIGMAANRFYRAVGFEIIGTSRMWVKEF